MEILRCRETGLRFEGCRDLIVRFYRPKDITAKNERKREYYQKNKHSINQTRRIYYLQNREAILRQNKAYYTRNKISINRRKRVPVPSVQRKWKWKSSEDVRKFFEDSEGVLAIGRPEDWYRVSRKQIAEVGGLGLFKEFGNLGEALRWAYPSYPWDLSKFSFRGKKSSQRWLLVILKQLLPPDTEIQEDYLHPELLWDEKSLMKMELDIWVPKYKIGLEYQGEQHYFDLHGAYGPSGTLAMYTERDLIKKNSCAKQGITFITIPYWWNGKRESLASTLFHFRPDVFPPTDQPPIPTSPSTTKERVGKLLDNEIASFLMHGREWDREMDPTGWYISEKLDGIRAFWNGSTLYSKTGKILPVPDEFTCSLPKDVSLDGELWAGYDTFSKLSSIFKRSTSNQSTLSDHWRVVKYSVFDAPMCEGSYPERHSFAQASISECSPHICMIPLERCLGLTHLHTKLQELSKTKGEGVMLYHPTAAYTPGRTGNLLKAKVYMEEDVKFVECNPNSYTFLCEQGNGATCIVKCSGWDYTNPPPSGTILTVRHSGYFKQSQKMKFPFLLKRADKVSF